MRAKSDRRAAATAMASGALATEFATGSPRPVVVNVFEAGLLAHDMALDAGRFPRLPAHGSGTGRKPVVYSCGGSRGLAVQRTAFPLSSGANAPRPRSGQGYAVGADGSNSMRVQSSNFWTWKPARARHVSVDLCRRKWCPSALFQVSCVVVRKVKREVGARSGQVPEQLVRRCPRNGRRVLKTFSHASPETGLNSYQ